MKQNHINIRPSSRFGTSENNNSSNLGRTKPELSNDDLKISDVRSTDSGKNKLRSRKVASKITDDLGPVKDWAKTNIFNEFITKGATEFNSTKDDSLLTITDNKHIYELIKQRYEDNQNCKGIMESFFSKSLNTFKELMQSIGLGVQYSAIKGKYDRTSVEDTLKLLIRNKMLFGTRELLFKIFN